MLEGLDVNFKFTALRFDWSSQAGDLTVGKNER